ncbi:MAG: histidinol-phosphate transaminase [Flavobacteriales bacterium]|nr:histidinol-phosphate transaminase [Flavobacteriales bacterium]
MNINNIVRKNILSLKPYSSARDEFTGVEGVFLDANENPFGELNRYPDPYQKELKEKLAALKGTSAENVFIGNGSDEVIDLAIRIFCNPGEDKALTFSPTYGMYTISSAINNVELIKVPLTREFQIDLNLTSDYLADSNLKMIFICSPNNPTGNLINENDIQYILNKFNGIVIIDEAYIEFSLSKSWLANIDKYPNLIVSQTFSKAWGLAAARVGVAYAGKEIIQLFNKVKPPYNVSGPNQKAVINALLNPSEYEGNLLTILDQKEKLEVALNGMEIIKKVYPSDANFFLIEVIDANRIYNELVNRQLITRNRNNSIDNCIRVSVGTPNENELLIASLREMKNE